jgi:hypothetical protein
MTTSRQRVAAGFDYTVEMPALCRVAIVVHTLEERQPQDCPADELAQDIARRLLR